MAILNPYINFRGQARDAMEFYQSVFGGDLVSNTFGEYQMPGVAEDEADNIMHSQLDTPNGMTLMASDTPGSMELAEGSNITISLSGGEKDELQGYWDKLSDGAQVGVPLELAPWGDYFGQLTDKFGVSWLVNIVGAQAEEGESGAEGTGTAGDPAPEEI